MSDDDSDPPARHDGYVSHFGQQENWHRICATIISCMSVSTDYALMPETQFVHQFETVFLSRFFSPSFTDSSSVSSWPRSVAGASNSSNSSAAHRQGHESRELVRSSLPSLSDPYHCGVSPYWAIIPSPLHLTPIFCNSLMDTHRSGRASDRRCRPSDQRELRRRRAQGVGSPHSVGYAARQILIEVK